MTALYIGAYLDRPPGPKYLERLSFAELALHDAMPRAGTLRKWRARMPETLRLAVVAPKSAIQSSDGPLRLDSEELKARVDRLKAAAAAVDACAIVIQTGPSVSTGQRDRDRLARFFEYLGQETLPVWSAGGLWEPELAKPFARRLGVTYALDPLVEDELPDGDPVYGRLKAIGGRNRFSEGMLWEAAARYAELDGRTGYLALESPRSFREASTLVSLISEDFGEAADADEDADELDDDDFDAGHLASDELFATDASHAPQEYTPAE